MNLYINIAFKVRLLVKAKDEQSNSLATFASNKTNWAFKFY